MKIASNRAKKNQRRVAGRLQTAPASLADLVFPKLSKPENRFGVAVMLALGQRQGGDAEFRFSRIEQAGPQPGRRPRQNLLNRIDQQALAKLLSGLAHRDRLRIACCILTGSNTHQLLVKSLGLKTGPLYHHLRELERAGLVAIASRNCYRLTETGEIVLVLLSGLNLTSEHKLVAWKREKARRPGRRQNRPAA